MDEYSITEVMEPIRCPGDGLSRETAQLEPEHETMEPLKDEDGPWKELRVANRHRKMLATGFMADTTVTVQDETFRCHSFILSTASPHLAALLRENSHELCLLDVEPRHFRIILEIVYTDEAKGLRDVIEILAVARSAHNLRVYAAVAFCTDILQKQLTVTHVLPILELALLVGEENLTKACTKVIRKKTSAILKSEDLKRCHLPVLKLILSENALHDVTELDLFQACVTWSEVHENPRQALGSTLGLVRFHLLTAQQFAKHVKPTKLLSGTEESDVFSCLVIGEGDMPAGFSNEKHARSMDQVESPEKTIVNNEIYIPLYWTGNMKNTTAEELATSPPLRFSLSADAYIRGVQVSSMREGAKLSERMAVTLKDEKGKSLATAKLDPVVISNGVPTPDLKFSQPVAIADGIIYSLHLTDFKFDGRQCISGRRKESYFTSTGLKINILEEVYTPIRYIFLVHRN